MGGKKRKPGEGGSVRDAFAFTPSALEIDYSSNCSRACLYTTPPVLQAKLGPKCPYTLQEIERRLKSLLRCGQIDAISIYLTATGGGVVVDGFLRVTAMLYAELVEPTEEVLERFGVKLKRNQSTLLDAIPSARSKVRCDGVTAPKSQSDYLALAERNFEENHERKELTPVDIAFYLSRLEKPETEGGFGLTREQVADKVHMSKRTVDRYLSLLALPPKTLAQLHEGRDENGGKVTMTSVLNAARDQGKGTSKGPRTSIKHSNIARAVRLADDRKPPTQQLSPDQLRELFAIVSGLSEVSDDTNQKIAAWAEWLNADKSAEPKKEEGGKKRKAAPAKIESRPGPLKK